MVGQKTATAELSGGLDTASFPITQDWLWSIGANEGDHPSDFERDFAFWNPGPHDCSDGPIIGIRRTGANVPYFARLTDSDEFGILIEKPMRTRGDFLLLCEAIGISVK